MCSFSFDMWLPGIKSRSSGLADQSCCCFYISTSDERLGIKVLMVLAGVMGLDTILRSLRVLTQFTQCQEKRRRGAVEYSREHPLHAPPFRRRV